MFIATSRASRSCCWLNCDGHLFLECLVKELSKNYDDRKYDQKRQDDYCGGNELFLLEEVNDTLKHGIIYIEKRGKVKQLNPHSETDYRGL